MNAGRVLTSILAMLACCSGCLGDDQSHKNSAPGTWMPNREIPELREAQQLILVITPGWDSVAAELTRFQREKPGGPWEQVSSSVPAVVGRSGLAWGIGLHSAQPPGIRPKREGDGRAPAGVFRLTEIFGYAPAAETGIRRFPYRALTQHTAGVDDPNSRFYNRIVEHDPDTPKDWSSAEKMRREDELYRWGVVVGHNERPFPAFGSCIFLHLWEAPDKGTAGCTAVASEHLAEIVQWLDQKKRPLLVQLPREEYMRRKGDWGLP